MGKYFTVDVDCEIAGSAQHAAFGAGDLLFDWHSFEIPRGGAKLMGATTLVRSKGDAGPTPNNLAFSLVFGKDGTSLGTANNVVFKTETIQEDVIGVMNFHANDFAGGTTGVSTMCQAIAHADAHVGNVVLQPKEASGTNVGYDKFYVAGVAGAAIDFSTILRINDDNIASVSPGTTLVTDGTSMLVGEHIIVGDVLVAHDDAAIGTVASITNTTTLELTETISTGVLAADDFVYVKHPIKLRLHFEK